MVSELSLVEVAEPSSQLRKQIKSRYLAGQRPAAIACALGCAIETVHTYVSRSGLSQAYEQISATRAQAAERGESLVKQSADHAAKKAEEYLARRLAGLEAKLAALDRVILDLPTTVGLDDLPVVVDALDRLDRIGRRTLGLGDGSGNPGKPTTAIQVNLLSSLQRPPDA
jgi:glutathione S-transferase